MVKTALPIQPPLVCVALLRKKAGATWLLYRALYRLLLAVMSATSLTLAFHYSKQILSAAPPQVGVNAHARDLCHRMLINYCKHALHFPRR